MRYSGCFNLIIFYMSKTLLLMSPILLSNQRFWTCTPYFSLYVHLTQCVSSNHLCITPFFRKKGPDISPALKYANLNTIYPLQNGLFFQPTSHWLNTFHFLRFLLLGHSNHYCEYNNQCNRTC